MADSNFFYYYSDKLLTNIDFDKLIVFLASNHKNIVMSNFEVNFKLLLTKLCELDMKN